MKNTVNPILLLSCMLFSSLLYSNPWLERKAEGWAWYEDKEETLEEPPPPEEEDKPLPLPPPLPPPSASEELAMLKKSFEDKLAKAVLYPTPINVGIYLEEQMKWLNRSEDFANIWAKYLLAQPHLDQIAKTPVTQFGVQAHRIEKYEQKRVLIDSLSHDYGMLFFFRGDCALSKAFAPVVKMFADQYHWKILPVSLDGKGVEQYPTPNTENGIAEKVGVSIAPALYAINPVIDEIRPIGFGVLSLDQIEQNIVLQFSPDKEDTHVQ